MHKKMLAFLLALIMVFALFGCTTVETPASAEPTTVPTTPSSEHLEAELTRIRELCAQEKEDLQLYKEELQMNALDVLYELDVAESTLLTGSPILVEFEYSTPGMGSRIETHTILAVSEGNVPFPYRFSSQGDVLEKVRFSLGSSKDVLSVNLHGYTPDANGVVEIDNITKEEWSGFEICWDRPKMPPFVAQFEVFDSESSQSNGSSSPDPSAVAVYLQEVNDLRPQLDEEQEKNIDDILAELQSLHEEITEYEEEYRPLFEHLEKVKHALYNGIPIQFAAEFETATPAINLMATEAGSPSYTFPNPWGKTPEGGEIHAHDIFFVTPFPGSTIKINGDTFSADKNGIVVFPLSGKPIPEEISLEIAAPNGTTYILELDGQEAYAVFTKFWSNMVN